MNDLGNVDRRLWRARLVRGFCLLLVLVLAGVAAEAAAPLCEDVCTATTSCTAKCTDGGATITCKQFGVCNSQPPCPTVQCAAGCAEKPKFTVSSNPAPVNQPVTFTADTSGIDPTSTEWDLGDGFHAFGVVTLDHAYAAPGDYRVCLWAVETRCDTRQSACKWISITGGGGPGCLVGGDDCEPQ